MPMQMNFFTGLSPAGVALGLAGIPALGPSWLDFGFFLQTLILAAQVRGLATCPQVSFVRC